MEMIKSTKNDRVKNWRKLQTKKGRQQEFSYLVEGFHLVEEALRQDGLVTELIIAPSVKIPEGWNTTNIPVFYVNKEVATSISETITDQGIFAVVKMEDPEIMMLFGKKFLLLDGVQDPGNVGTLIRTADAAGYDAVVLGRGSADLYNPKVIRSTQGSHFHIPVLQANLLHWVERFEEEGVPIFGAVLDDTATKLQEVEPRETLALMVGNEGNGIQAELQTRLTHKVYIPIYGASESLNVAVAAGILMYGLRK
ncbi:TrmH family RNA methyltransferase [Paenilisteria rocourtiae]|uniref:TrmH family RNA methyltransferase n=1 Tax=Listeria rocourtiae TaxID=647910 RepID=A0A4R6ZR69_9LIST|nr:RNA methyltransferase [Listeria rocourtiae]EUJ44368.1 TrmH family RNA methyltransferase [Listeria rocourtiae FSL F6-920]MBC1436304.1 RNA methyltransferase [Listeria rocourtiae]MBC1603563.1 RNA methyltransferase [Listeria rocourtiae]TDR55151.1 TrmH family RNA methyltransferase [Listeria rocourtiae]